MTDLCSNPGSRSRAGTRGDWRLILLMGVFGLCYAAVGLRMAHMAATEPSEPQLARSDRAGLPVRGEITDRNGELLAANLPAWSLYAHPGEISDKVKAATDLAGIFPELNRDTLLKRLTDGRRFVWIKRPIGPREKQAVHDLGTPGLHFGRREMRIYPAGRTAAHVVGGVEAEREDVPALDLSLWTAEEGRGSSRAGSLGLFDPGRHALFGRESLVVYLPGICHSSVTEVRVNDAENRRKKRHE